MLQELEIMTAWCEEDSTDRMLQELETVTARWDEDSIVAKCGDRFEKKHGVRFTPLEDLLADKIKTLRKDLKDVRAASPKTKRERLNILAMVKDEVEDIMLSSGDESDKEEAAGSDDPDTKCYDGDELPKEEAAGSDDPPAEWA